MTAFDLPLFGEPDPIQRPGKTALGYLSWLNDGLWLATWWPWACPCGARGFGAASRQQHAAEHRGATL